MAFSIAANRRISHSVSKIAELGRVSWIRLNQLPIIFMALGFNFILLYIFRQKTYSEHPFYGHFNVFVTFLFNI